MKFLMEKEVGFDPMQLGFPSIMGCHAVVYQTNTGLYGFHIAGSSAGNLWAANANCFRQFVFNHGGLALPASRLYGVSFIGNNRRGYDAPAKRRWKEELITFANALNYHGKISGYDLTKSYPGDTSVYVEYRKNGLKCDVLIRQWLRATDPGGPENFVRVVNPQPAAHKIIQRHLLLANLAELPSVVQNVNRHNLLPVHKEQLR